MKRQRLARAAAHGIGLRWGMRLGLGLAAGWASAQGQAPAAPPALPASAASPASAAPADGRPAVKLPELRDLGLSVPRPIKAASALVGMGRQRLALVVGMGTVGARQVVDNAPRDAQAVAAALRGAGFVVMLREDISGADLRAALKEFHERLQPDGLGFVFFSGLGAQVDGQNLLLPRDAVLDAQAPLAERLSQLGKAGVPMSEAVDALMGPSKSPRLLVVDAAYRHPALAGLPAPGLQAQKLPPGVMALYGQALGQQQEVPAVAPLASPPPTDAREIAASAFTRTLVGEMLASRRSAPEVLRGTRRKLFDGSLGQTDPWLGGDTDPEELAEATLIDSVIPRTPEELAREAASQALRAMAHQAGAAAPATGTAAASAAATASASSLTTAGEQSVASVLQQAPKPPVRPEVPDAGQVLRPTAAKGLPADGSPVTAEPPAPPAAAAAPAANALPSVGPALGTAASVAGAALGSAVSAAGTVASVATTAATVAAVAKATEAAAAVSVATTAVGAAASLAGQVAALATRLVSSPSGEAPAAAAPQATGSAAAPTVASNAAVTPRAVAGAATSAELPVQAVNEAADRAAAAARIARAASAQPLAGTARPAGTPSTSNDPRTVKNPEGGERPAYNPRRNANGYAEGDTYTYQVSDAWKGEITGRYTTAIEEVLDNGQMLADGHQTVMDAMGRLKQQRNADGSVSRFEPAQELWWSNPQRGQSRALQFTETVQRGERQSQIEWKGSTSVGSPRRIETPAGAFEALPIESSGWAYEPVAGGLNSTKWTRTVWYSPQLGHPVAIDIEDADRLGKLLKRERVELLHAQSARNAP